MQNLCAPAAGALGPVHPPRTDRAIFGELVAYSCTPGQRIRAADRGVGTVAKLRGDGYYDVDIDNAKHSIEVNPFADTIALCNRWEYKAQDRICVYIPPKRASPGLWAVATVLSSPATRIGRPRHKLSIQQRGATSAIVVEMDLNEFNHVSDPDFVFARIEYNEHMQQEHRMVRDAVTSAELDIEKQLLNISLADRGSKGASVFSKAESMVDLAHAIAQDNSKRQHGIFANGFSVVVRANPGTGKTWGSKAVALALAKHNKVGSSSESIAGAEATPLFVPVQRLARILRERGRGTHVRGASDGVALLQWYIDTEYGTVNPSWAAMLTYALQSKSLVVILDGVDEAAALRETVQQLALDGLASSGIRVMVTSRPEGIPEKGGVLDRFRQRKFHVFDLSPLSEEETWHAINQQLEDSDFFSNLFKFGEIRKKHNATYERHIAPAVRDTLETLPPMNRLVLADTDGGGLDPDMRQHHDKSHVVERLKQGEAPRSLLFTALCSKGGSEHGNWSETGLGQLDTLFDRGVDVADMSQSSSLKRYDAKLIALAQKYSKTSEVKPSQLARQIILDTDQIYVTNEAGDKYFRPALEALFSKCSDGARAHDGDVQVFVAALKDPVRVYEKGEDDYGTRAGIEGVTPRQPSSAWVLDIIRGKGVVADARAIISMVSLLQQEGGVCLEVRMNPHSAEITRCRFEMIRIKNKFSLDTLDPSRLRNVLLNLHLTVEGTALPALFVELQLHHLEIYNHEQKSGSHDVYNYFRALLTGDGYVTELDAMLERAVTFLLDDVCKVPVLLSLLIVAARGNRTKVQKPQIHGSNRSVSAWKPEKRASLWDDEPSKRLPTSLQDLYRIAIEEVLEDLVSLLNAETFAGFSGDAQEDTNSNAIVQLFEAIAAYNMRDGQNVKREFTSHDIELLVGARMSGPSHWRLRPGMKYPQLKAGVAYTAIGTSRGELNLKINAHHTTGFISEDFFEEVEWEVPEAAQKSLALWQRLTTLPSGNPLVKVVVDANDTVDDGDGPSVYQFRHLSLQEAFFSMAMIRGSGSLLEAAWQDDSAAVTFLNTPTYRNTIKIGGQVLGAEFGGYRGQWRFFGDGGGSQRQQRLDAIGLEGLLQVACRDGPFVLDVSSNTRLGDGGVSQIAYSLRLGMNVKLTQLVLADVGMTGSGLKTLCQSMLNHGAFSVLRVLDVSSNTIGGAGLTSLSATITTSVKVSSPLQLQTLKLNKIGIADGDVDAVSQFAAALSLSACKVHHVEMMHNKMWSTAQTSCTAVLRRVKGGTVMVTPQARH